VPIAMILAWSRTTITRCRKRASPPHDVLNQMMVSTVIDKLIRRSSTSSTSEMKGPAMASSGNQKVVWVRRHRRESSILRHATGKLGNRNGQAFNSRSPSASGRNSGLSRRFAAAEAGSRY